MKRINQNNQKNNINNNINNNKNNNKKTRKKIIIPKIKDIQTTPDLSCMYPILEDNLVMCIHGGKVNLKAKNAKRIQSNNIPIMLNNEIQGASISGCLNPPILGGPCSKVALVFPYTFTQHQVNHKRAVLQMGLIGVSDKAYPILAIPKKNTIKFSPMKLKANPLDKIEYERIQWEGIKKEKEKKVESKSISSVVNQEQELPPNIIRIETLDESEEFIEIVLPPTFHIDDQPLMDVSTLFIPPALKGVGSTIKGIKGAGNAGKGAKFARSLTRQEVLEVVDRLPNGLKSNGDINERVKLVKSKKELDELWERLTKNAKELEPEIDKRHGKPIYKRQLDDGTNINYRVDSKTGGETIDINSRNPKTNIKIHIDKGI